MVDIVPLKSIGNLEFFCSKEQVHTILGKPNRIETQPFGRTHEYYGGDIATITYNDEFGFVAAELIKPPAFINGKDLFSLSLNGLVSFLEKSKIEFQKVIDEVWEEEIDIFITEWCTYCYFDESKLESLEVSAGIWDKGRFRCI